jgi:hypothetical protein
MNERFCAQHTDYATKVAHTTYHEGPHRFQALEQQQQQQRSMQVARTALQHTLEGVDNRVYGSSEWAFAD